MSKEYIDRAESLKDSELTFSTEYQTIIELSVKIKELEARITELEGIVSKSTRSVE